MKLTPGDPMIDPDDFWVFGYASLMWRPGFTFAEAQPAALTGYRRDMCFLSIHYRGTSDAPGLVCGLMQSDSDVCKGLAYRVDRADISTAMDYLDVRELVTDIYIPRHLPIVLTGGRTVTARIYVADDAHAQFVGCWTDDEKAAAIVRGTGSEGRSLDYLANVVAHLHDMGIDDTHLTALLKMSRARGCS